METSMRSKEKIGFVLMAILATLFMVLASDSQVRIAWTLYLIGLVLSALLGILFVLKIVLKITPQIKDIAEVPQLLEALNKVLHEHLDPAITEKNTSDISEAPVFSRNVDREVRDILEKLSIDYVMSWLQPLLEETHLVNDVDKKLKRDVWAALKKLNERLSNIDKVQLLSSDLIQRTTEHFTRLRTSTQEALNGSKEDPVVEFHVPAYLVDKEREIEYLGKITDILILFLFPSTYSTCIGTRATLREILSRHVFYVAIDSITNPRTINKSILTWISNMYREVIDSNNTLAIPVQNGIKLESVINANSYQEFLSSLTDCNDVTALKKSRYNILTEIVQATTLGDLSSAKAGGGNGSVADEDATKKEKLQIYVTKLVRAKTVCEDRLQELGLEGCFDPNSDIVSRMSSSLNSIDTIDTFMAGRKNLSFPSIMHVPFSRRYFYAFLEQQHMQDLLGFWTAVEELKEAEKTLWHQLATEIFYTFINKPVKVIKVEKSKLKQIEAFLLGDSNPEIFHVIQNEVTQTLESTYYPAFIISDLCYKMLEDAHEGKISITDEPELKEDPILCTPPANGETNMAKAHLDHVNEKLQNKVQALKALQGSLKPDSKVLKMLHGQIETLQQKKVEVEQHLERTEAWVEHLGKWSVHVHVEEDEDAAYIATMIVHVPNTAMVGGGSRQQKYPSWVCQRNVKDFHALNRELMPCSSWLKSMSLPSSENSGASSFIHFASKSSNNSSQSRSEKTRIILQKYIDAVLSDERLNQSEVIYTFLSPSPSYLKSGQYRQLSIDEEFDPRSGQKFTFPNLFKSQDKATTCSEEGGGRRLKWMDSKKTAAQINDDAKEDVLDEFDTPDIGSVGDGVAEPLYSLVSEIFEIRGVFRILRKSLMTFVQITYGSTINKHIKDTVAWLTSDLMIARCLKTIKLTLWPMNSATETKEETPPDPLADEVAKAKAKAALIAHVPDWLSTMVGQQSSKMGISKVFDTIQEKTLNKLLVYDLLEVIIYSLFPELVRSYAFQQFRNMSM